MEFRALGPMEVLSDGGTVDIGAPKQRALLALLLIHANQVVSTDRILDELWGDDAAGKENALWVHISRLRSALEPGRAGRGESTVLLKRGSGYMLKVDVNEFDVTRFDGLVGEGRAVLAENPARAHELISEALHLWRGPAYDDVRYEQFAQVELARLEEARVSALEDRIEADLKCGQDGELVSELEVLRSSYPLRERPVCQLMLALYRSGRPAEALRAFDRFRRLLGDETGLEPSPALCRLEEQVVLHDVHLRRPTTAGPPESSAASAVNPFKGLRPFLEEDSHQFFGRDRLVAETLRVLRSGSTLVTVVGASGSGKSSLVRAGLVPALRKDAITDSSRWLIANMVPGSRPLAELEAALLRAALDAPASLAAQLEDNDAGILRAVLRVLPESSERLVLVIDQFEELFTLVDATARAEFLDRLVVALDDPHHRLTVVATLRADFYGHALTHPALGARLASGVVNVVPLTAVELELAAHEPASQSGVSFEAALLAQLISDVGRDPGSLPLFQFTLAELFDRRIDDVLSISTYLLMGGVAGALSRRSDQLFDELAPDEQLVAEQLFLRLVTVTEDNERGRRRVTAAEILSLGVDPIAMQAVIQAFGAHRLLTFDADPLTGAPTVEVAHEALLTSWPRLSAWIEHGRDDIRRHRSFAVALREWELSRRNPDYLLTGARLAEYATWARSSSMHLTTPECEFIEDSQTRDDEALRREDERRTQQATLSRRARRRSWGLVGAIGLIGTLTAVLLVAWVGQDSPPRVGLVAWTADNAFGANIAAGAERAEQEYDFQLDQVETLIDQHAQFREMAESHPDLIISDAGVVGSDVFADFPDINFGVIDGVVDAPNTQSILFANEQGAYLVGMAAALKSQTGIVGFVGAVPGNGATSFEDFRAGYEAGAKAVSPTITVLATYIEQPLVEGFTYFLNAFARQDLARERALELYSRGADVVFHAAGNAGFGVFRAAVDQSHALGRHLWAIGVDSDQWFQISDPETRDHLLTSMIKRADLASYLIIEDYLSGNFHPGVRTLQIADGALDYSTQGSGMTAAIRARLDQAKADIISGRIIVPTIPSGELLDLDPLPTGFADAVAQVGEEEFWVIVDESSLLYSAEWEEACWVSGTRATCAQFILERLRDAGVG